MSLFWIAQITCKDEQGKWIHSDPSLSNQCTWSSPKYQRSPGRDLELFLELRSWKRTGSCSTAAASSGEVPFVGCWRARGDMQWETQCSQCAQPLPQNSSGRSADCQMELGGSSGELQCKYPCDKSSKNARLTWADCLSLPHSPIWKDSLDDFFQRPCSLSTFQRESCYLHILIIWDIFILRITIVEYINIKEETKEASIYLCIYIFLVI